MQSISKFSLWTKPNHQGERGEVINTCEAYSLTEAIIIFAQIKQLKPNQPISFHSRIPKTLKEQKQYVLEAFPGIGPITAKKLLKEFKTLSASLNASLEDIEKVIKGKAKSFKKILNS